MADAGSAPFSGLAPGDLLGPLRLTVSAAANERYWSAAAVDHPALRAGALYPLIAANLTVLTFGAHCPDAMIQTRQHLVCHQRGAVDVELETTAEVLERYERRDRDYIVLQAEVVQAGAPLWTSTVHFTPALVPTNEASS
ncbi:MAG TPA: hypothetical protein VGO03_00800 [Acidimicrobiia bacterium]|jgi:hypothetical protein